MFSGVASVIVSVIAGNWQRTKQIIGAAWGVARVAVILPTFVAGCMDEGLTEPRIDEAPVSLSVATDFAGVVGGIRPRGFGQDTYALVQPAAGGVTYYVSSAGSDSNPGTSSLPFLTINRARRGAPRCALGTAPVREVMLAFAGKLELPELG